MKALGLLLCLLVSCWAQATDKTIVVGVEDLDNLPCCAYNYKAQQFRGYAREVFDAFAAHHDYKIIYKALPIKRLYFELVSGKVDLKFPDNPVWGQSFKRDSAVTYSKPLLTYFNGILTPKGTAIYSLKDLNSISFVRGFDSPILKLATERHGIQIIETNQSTEAIAMVLNHKADGVFFNTLGAAWLLKYKFNQPKALLLNTMLPHTPASYFASSVSHPDLIEALNQFMSKNKMLLKQLKQKYDIPEVEI